MFLPKSIKSEYPPHVSWDLTISRGMPPNLACKFHRKLTSAAFDLLCSMFQYDPAKRPSATEILEHPYFVSEEPAPRQAIEWVSLSNTMPTYDVWLLTMLAPL